VTATARTNTAKAKRLPRGFGLPISAWLVVGFAVVIGAFATTSIVAVRGTRQATADLATMQRQFEPLAHTVRELGDAMAALLAAADSNPVVAHHRGGRGGQAALKDLKKAAATTIDCQPLKKGRALNEFVTNEFKRQKRRITSDALALLIEAVGTDLADLASAAHQLSSDAQSDPIDAQVVGQYFRGVAELSGYQVADAVMLGHPAEVLQRLRQAQIAADGARTGPAIVAAVAGSVRQLIALSASTPGLSDADLARQVGVPPWKLRTLRAQLRRWKPAQLAQAVTILADLDARVKGGLREGEQLDAAQKLHALERDLISLSVE